MCAGNSTEGSNPSLSVLPVIGGVTPPAGLRAPQARCALLIAGIVLAGCDLSDPVRVETSAPHTTITEAPAPLTNTTSARLRFACDEPDCTFVCRLDDRAEAPCRSPFETADLTDGAHRFLVRATDAVGNVEVEPPEHTWSIDTVPPSTIVERGPDPLVRTSSAAFRFACNGSPRCLYSCRIDGTPSRPCDAQLDLRVSLGAHTLLVRAIDEAGNVDPEGVLWSWNVEQSWTSVRTSRNTTCAIAQDGTLWCWGTNTYGQVGDFTFTGPRAPLQVGSSSAYTRFDPPFDRRPFPVQVGTDTDWVDLAPAQNYTCARKRNGSLWCWGHNADGELGEPIGTAHNAPVEVTTSTVPWRSVTRSYNFTCAVRDDGTVWCWGNNGSGQLADGTTERRTSPFRVLPGQNWSSVSVGSRHACALRADGVVTCWGNNRFAQLARTATDAALVPAPVASPNGAPWIEVRAGFEHTCGRTEDRRLWCWGRNNTGRLGVGTFQGRDTPTQVGRDADWDSVAPGIFGTCGTRNGELWCWGENGHGELGDGTRSDARPFPVRVGVESEWRDVTVGHQHTCAVDARGRLSCWGHDQEDQLATGDRGDARFPTRVTALDGATTVSLNQFDTCAIDDTGAAHCWGFNGQAQLGRPAGDGNAASPVRLSEGSAFVDVASGLDFTCAIDGDGDLVCVGANARGQLGNGDVNARSSLTPVVEPGPWAEVCAGRWHVCARKPSNRVWCWGRTGYERVGAAERADPIPSEQSGRFVSLSCGETHNCAIDEAGDLYCWGSNQYGQLGVGDDAASPTRVAAGHTWRAVAAGIEHTCAIDEDGGLWCWGRNQFGQLGFPSEADRPTRVGARSDWADVAAGDATCAIDAETKLWCWGRNDAYQLGDGSAEHQPEPTPVSDGAGWTSLRTHRFHTCGLRDGALWCWGFNTFGQLGVGVEPVRPSPTEVKGRR